jgi:DNA-binding protein HU-beta
VNRRELVAEIAERLETDKRSAEAFVQHLVDIITEIVSKGEPVSIPGFAKFARRDSKARMGRNPATGEAIRIKASKKVRITPLKAFKDAALAGRPVRKAAPVKKVAVRATAARKAPVAKKAPARKGAAKKAPARKAPVRKAPARKAPVAKKAPVRRAAVKKAPAKKAVVRKAPVKRTVAKRAPAKRTTR